VLALPEALFWYRVDATSMLRTRPDGAPDMRRGMRAYTDRVPPVLRSAVLAGITDALALPAARQQAANLRKAADARWDRIKEQRGIIALQAKRLAELRDVAKARLDRIEALRAVVAALRLKVGTGQGAAAPGPTTTAPGAAGGEALRGGTDAPADTAAAAEEQAATPAAPPDG
jgi:hypothetical protein